jgi:hypothetical protein
VVTSLLPRPAATVLAALALAACGESTAPPENPPPTTPPPTSLSGNAQDPAGDGGTADLVGVTATADPDSIIFQIQFAPGVLGTGDRSAELFLDIDNQESTGDATKDPVGAEYDVYVLEDQASVLIYHYQSGNWVGLGSAGAIYVTGNTLSARLPRSAFGGDEGGLRFKVTSGSRDSGCGCFTGQDQLPNAGMPPVVVQ